MKALDKLKVLLSIVKGKFSEVESDGLRIYFDGEELVVDTVVYDEEGNPIPDGEYSDGEKVYVIKDSKVVEIKEKEVEKEVEEEEVVKVENACGDEEKKKVEAAETETETTETETTEKETTETEETPTDGPTVDERVEVLETRIDEMQKGIEDLFAVIMEMKEKQTEVENKNEEIIREFSAISKSPTVESITKDNSSKIYNETKSISDKLNFLKNNK